MRYNHLGLDERRTIYRMLEAGKSVSAIAEQLARHPSTIYREISRNKHIDSFAGYRGYFHVAAHDKARSRRLRGGKILGDNELISFLTSKLEVFWSPEQISGYMKTHKPYSRRVCHETIYQFVYSPYGRQHGIGRLLPKMRSRRRKRYARKIRGIHIPLANTIAERPGVIAERERFGDWEGDLVMFRREFGKSNITSLVERLSRFTILKYNRSRHSAGVIGAIVQRLRPLPPPLRRTITLDRGTEFANYPILARRLGMTSYFCKPSAPWQKGAVENMNGRLRRFMPSNTDIGLVSQAELDRIANIMNNTPRKRLEFRTPKQVFDEQVKLVQMI